jgi:hypothetical protein
VHLKKKEESSLSCPNRFYEKTQRGGWEVDNVPRNYISVTFSQEKSYFLNLCLKKMARVGW